MRSGELVFLSYRVSDENINIKICIKIINYCTKLEIQKTHNVLNNTKYCMMIKRNTIYGKRELPYIANL